MSECVSETLLLGIHRSRCCEVVNSKWWGKWHLCVQDSQESHHLEHHLLLRHFIFSVATYHTTPRIQFYFVTDII